MNIQQYELCGYAIDVIIYDHIFNMENILQCNAEPYLALVVICAKTNSKSDF